jgi:diacylglycerol kinase (ATP)
MKSPSSAIRKRLTAFRYAFRGIGRLLCCEPNARIHTTAGVCVIIAGFVLKISGMEWIAVVIVTGAVFAAEAFNTAIEQLSDLVSPGYSEAVKRIKDLAAGAVLLTALSAALVGLIIFLPKIITLCR